MNNDSGHHPEKKVGRLVGWLISFGISDQGVAYEIRSGRTFLGSREDGTDSAIVVAESSIDSPHLAIKASQKHRIHVQDVFSRAGSFIRRGSSEQETRLQGPIELEHGDWIRVGNEVRFQVCLIEATGR